MKPCIFLVDNEAEVLKKLCDLFEREDYNYLAFDNPLKALEALAEHSPLLVIAGHNFSQMPGMDFFAAVRDFNSEIVRIMLTAYCCDMKLLLQGLESWLVNVFMQKPWNDEELLLEAGSVFKYHEDLSNS